MKKFVLLMVLIALAGCAASEREEDDGGYTPFPGGKCCEGKPKA